MKEIKKRLLKIESGANEGKEELEKMAKGKGN